MSLKRSLMLAGIVFLILFMALSPFKWPWNHPMAHYNQATKAKEETASPSNSAADTINPADDTTSTPDLVSPNQAPVREIPFPPEGIPALMYHSISTIPGNPLGVPVKQFREEMEWLRRQNYHSVSLEEFYRALVSKSQIPDKPVLITFDDGYEDNYTEAWPILKQNGFRAAFFIITDSVGPGMMTWPQLNELVRQGNSIGSHTVHHLDLATLSYKQQESELLTSKEALESHLGIRIEALCFPSGRYNDTTLKLMPKAGYLLGFTTKPGRVHWKDDVLTLKRLRISGGMSLDSFKELFP